MSDNENRDRTIVVTEKVRLDDNGSTYEPYLIQISGRETGQMYNLKGRNVKLGRDPSCQIPLDDPHVSRNHAEIIWRNGSDLVIRDVGSTNGIFVNGKKVQEQVLLDGDKILIGTRLYFKFVYQDSVDQSYQQNLFRAANIDGLTQLYNKKYFVDVLSKEFSFSKRNKTPLSLLMIDVDHFKKINDTHGHIAGDLVLKHIGQYLHKSLRLENIACRYGGEEFAIILRNVDATTAMQIAERVRLNVEKQPVTYRNENIFITISLGVATFENGNFETIEDFIRTADECLYAAKQGGRNRTVMREAA
ncbi:MAG: GGDEF domain-containing protein [Bdellovibrionaceae bacterium]|nr:GGDEF domain-containing protein [Bdellovibrionales bacterium]MCB9253867.1 GGDEF domain-containing protein [Pseudobdellovibrionaceae bacterium]